MNYIKKLSAIILLMLLHTSCVKYVVQDTEPLVLNNKALENEIIAYKQYVDSVESKPYVLKVYYLPVNELTNKFVITYGLEADSYNYFPYHFTCKVADVEVFFIVYPLQIMNNDYEKVFFKNSPQAVDSIRKRCFPEEQKRYERFLKTGDDMRVTILNHPQMYDLTFVHDKLVKKVIRGGLIDEIGY